MNRVDEGALAWALADSAGRLLKPAERASVCATIGAGEQESAIRHLLGLYADTQAELPRELAPPIQAWIRGYAGSDCEPGLRCIYDRIVIKAASAPGPYRTGSKPTRPRQQLVARRNAHAARVAADKHSTAAVAKVETCGFTTSVEALVRAAIDARRAAHQAIEVAVREARSVNWSWDRISWALGGEPDQDSLRRRFG